MVELDARSESTRITGTFLDETSNDIPAQNWGRKEWRRDFRIIEAVGIDTVILIRCGHKRWMTYPSDVLAKVMGCFTPPVDLVRMFLDLAEELGMRLYFGTYDSGRFWREGNYREEIGISKDVVSEVWEEIFSGIQGAVDIIAFQDGHVEFDELPEYLLVNRDLARRHGMESWSNLETFDGDMPVKFLPIKWEKLLLKLEAARAAGVEEIITFEFSRFLSPQSSYHQAPGLLRPVLRTHRSEAARRGGATPRYGQSIVRSAFGPRFRMSVWNPQDPPALWPGARSWYHLACS